MGICGDVSSLRFSAARQRHGRFDERAAGEQARAGLSRQCVMHNAATSRDVVAFLPWPEGSP